MRSLIATSLTLAAFLTAMLVAFSLFEERREGESSARETGTTGGAVRHDLRPDPEGNSEGAVRITGCEGEELVLGEIEARLVELHNEEREARGLATLCVRRELVESSRLHSEDMLSRDYFAHETPEGVGAFERMQEAGYTLDGFSSIKTGENLAWRTHYGEFPEVSEAREVVEGWLDSEGHRENLLDPGFREIGVGIATGEYEDYDLPATMYTVNFGSRG